VKALAAGVLELHLEFGGFKLSEVVAVGSQGYLSRFLEDASTRL
jgi:hypothetical protein